MLLYDFVICENTRMFRGVLSALSRRVTPVLYLQSPSIKNGVSSFIPKSLLYQQNANFTSLIPSLSPTTQLISKHTNKAFLQPQTASTEQIRTVIKFSWKKGKRKTVKAVLKRFFRLRWGIWIRPMAGRHKKLWKKSASQRNRLLQHVFCNATQSRMLDTMVNKFWRKPKFYIDDPYEVYHKRENFYVTKRKPWRPEGVDYE